MWIYNAHAFHYANVHCYACPEVTLCGWQDIKIHYRRWPIKTLSVNFSQFSDFYTFEYLIYLYTFCENLGTIGKIFLGQIRVRNN